MLKVRSQRNYLRDLKQKTLVSPKTFRSIYIKIKGNQFRSKRHVKMYLEENKLFTTK
jgi:ribosomal protein L19E